MCRGAVSAALLTAHPNDRAAKQSIFNRFVGSFLIRVSSVPLAFRRVAGPAVTPKPDTLALGTREFRPWLTGEGPI